MKDENEQCQHCNRSSLLAGLQTCLALQIKWHFTAPWCQHVGAGRDHRARRVAVSRPSHVEHIIVWTQSMCRYLEAEFWPCHSLWGHSKRNKYQGVMIMIWRRQVDVGMEEELIARYTNSGGGSMWFRWAGKADQKTEQRKDTGYETLLLRVSGVFVTESKSCPSVTPRLSPETDSQEAFYRINTQKCLILNVGDCERVPGSSTGLHIFEVSKYLSRV